MSPRHQAVAGVAMQPVMDMSDGRVIAYRAHPRATDPSVSPVELLDAALDRARTTAPAPILVPLAPRLLVSSTFDAVARARAANCAPSEVVWVMPDAEEAVAADPELPPPPVLAAAVRRQSAILRESGFRIGLDGIHVLSVSWEDVVTIRPTFLLLDSELTRGIGDDLHRAALAGILAFAGHIGARLVARDVATDIQTAALMDVGVFYGTGDHLHGPVVLEEEFAAPGDLVVRPSWFRERAVRRLSMFEGEEGTRFVPEAPRPAVVDDRRLAGLLTEWAGVLSNAENPDAVMAEVAEIIPQVVSFDRLAIFEADWDRYALSAKVLIGEALQPLVGSTTAINTGITGWAFLGGSPYRCGRTTDHPQAAPIPGQDEADESLLVVPLVSGDRRLGVLDLWRDGADQFTDYDLERAALVGKLAADAWRLSAEREELAERVVTDTGTGLLNKRWWDELAPREAAQTRRAGGRIAVLLVDLDGFKEVNDSHGHAAGDAVLRQVARSLQATVRSGDAVVRYGGDEFILMLRDSDEQGARDVAAEVQRGLARIALPGGRETSLGASIGIAFFPDHGPTLDDVAVRADAAMYQAKQSGGGRIATFSPLEEPDDSDHLLEHSGHRGASADYDVVDGGVPQPVSSAEERPSTDPDTSPDHDWDADAELSQDRGHDLQLQRREELEHEHPSAADRLDESIVLKPAAPPARVGPSPRPDLEHRIRRFEYSERLARIGSFEMDLGSGAMEWSPEMYRVLGAPRAEEPTIAGIIDRVHPQDMERYGDAITKWIADGWGHFELGIWIVRDEDGVVVPAYLTQEIHTLGNGRRVLSGTLQELPHQSDESDQTLALDF